MLFTCGQKSSLCLGCHLDILSAEFSPVHYWRSEFRERDVFLGSEECGITPIHVRFQTRPLTRGVVGVSIEY